MGRLAGFRCRQIIKKLKVFGFEFFRHEILHNPSTGRFTTIPNHPGDMPDGTLRAILEQAGITPDEFLEQRYLHAIFRR